MILLPLLHKSVLNYNFHHVNTHKNDCYIYFTSLESICKIVCIFKKIYTNIITIYLKLLVFRRKEMRKIQMTQ